MRLFYKHRKTLQLYLPTGETVLVPGRQWYPPADKPELPEEVAELGQVKGLRNAGDLLIQKATNPAAEKE